MGLMALTKANYKLPKRKKVKISEKLKRGLEDVFVADDL